MVYDEYKLPFHICSICLSNFTGNGTFNGTYDVTMWWYLLIFMSNVDSKHARASIFHFTECVVCELTVLFFVLKERLILIDSFRYVCPGKFVLK